MRTEAKIKVVYLIDAAGISKGTETSFKESLANQLIEKGIVGLAEGSAQNTPKAEPKVKAKKTNK